MKIDGFIVFQRPFYTCAYVCVTTTIQPGKVLPADRTSRAFDVFQSHDIAYRVTWFSTLSSPGVVCDTVYARYYVKFGGRRAGWNTVVNGHRLCRSYAWEKRQVFRHTVFFPPFTPPAAAAWHRRSIYTCVCKSQIIQVSIPPPSHAYTHTHSSVAHSHSGIGEGEGRFCSTATTFGVYV